ncbi:hypothetical protein Tco_0436696, partial [Tanacetum coccineum]
MQFPPPTLGTYMPSRPDLSFAGLDDSVYKTKVSETIASKTSKDNLEKPKTIRPSAPIIEDWDTASDNDSVFRPKSDQKKPKFTKINFVKSDENVRPKVNEAFTPTYSYFKAHSLVKRAFNQKSAAKTYNLNEKVKTAKVNNVTTVGPKAVVSAAVRNGENADQEIFDSGCSRYMTGNNSFLTDYQEIDGGFVAFGGSPKGDDLPTDPLIRFWRILVMQRDDGIFISQDKYVVDILKKFDFVTMKTASTPIKTNKALLKDEEAEDVDVHLYRSMIGSFMYLTASRPDIMFAVCTCIMIDEFVDQHNMVACLERTEENAEFHQIVDFLTTSSIHYALTVSPTIYASYIEQFWNTANSQTVNDVKQIHATVDGKIVVISESSVRSDLHFNDEDGITCLANTTIFKNLALMGQALQKGTQLPQTSVSIPNVVGEAIFKERDDRVVRATTTAASIDAAQANGNITKTQSTAMSNDPLYQEIGSGERPRCQEAMRGAIAQTRSERTSKHSYDSPLPRVNIPVSDKERNKQQDLTDLYHQHPMIHLSQEVTHLEVMRVDKYGYI